MQAKVEDLPHDHHIVRYNKGLREQLLPHENGQPQTERGLFAAKVRTTEVGGGICSL